MKSDPHVLYGDEGDGGKLFKSSVFDVMDTNFIIKSNGRQLDEQYDEEAKVDGNASKWDRKVNLVKNAETSEFLGEDWKDLQRRRLVELYYTDFITNFQRGCTSRDYEMPLRRSSNIDLAWFSARRVARVPDNTFWQ